MNPFLILFLILLFFGAIALVVFLLRKYVPGIKEKEGEIDEQRAVQEELDRVLEPIEEEHIKKEVENFKDEINTPKDNDK
ncbi:MAG: hypothetical protein ACOX28_00535 [Bacilli bacterium]|jgi:hypothetical protein